jgi:hypothetical protein
MMPLGRSSVAGRWPRFENEVVKTETRNTPLTAARTIPRAEAEVGTSLLKVPDATIQYSDRNSSTSGPSTGKRPAE